MHTFASVAAAITVAAVMGLAPARIRAQQPAPVTWTGFGGYHSYDFRDVSRHGRPVDASPVIWHGEGPSARVRYERDTRSRAHRIDFAWTQAAHFSYESPLTSTDAARGDRATMLAATYGYRRYPVRDAVVRGLDLGAGFAGGATRFSVRHEFPQTLVITERRNGFQAAGVLTARLRRWERLTIETSWSHGLTVEHRRAEHSESSGVQASWGGWWYSDWSSLASIRLSPNTAVVVEHLRVQDGFTTTHEANVTARRYLLLGVAYAR